MAPSLAEAIALQIAAVMTQPGRPRGRGSKKVPQPSLVAERAISLGYDEEQILSPVKASEVCPLPCMYECNERS